MRTSFYHWLMTKRHPKPTTAEARLADLVAGESDFPKHTDDFDTISRFLEEDASFAFSMSDFDQIWETYLDH